MGGVQLNALTKLLNISVPIIQGGMGNISNAKLTAAVSDAGGLGTIGAGTFSPEELEKILLETKQLTDKPFAVNIPIKVTPYINEVIELILTHKIPVVSLSAGNPALYIERLKSSGIKIISVVASKKQAQKSEAAGADMIVAEGFEAAGINSNLETTTLTLVPQIVDAVSIPVVGAGGIGDGRGLAALLALGASGVQMGTRLVATKDAPFHDEYKKKLLEANDHETIIVGRTFSKTRRILNTVYAQKLLEMEGNKALSSQFAEATSEYYHKIGALDGKQEEGFMNSGQIAGLINDLPTVKELFDRMIKEAKAVYSQASGLLDLESETSISEEPHTQ